MCKRYNNLKDLILSDSNIIQAELNARKNKSKTYGVKRYDNRDDLTLDKIKEQLISGQYQTSLYHIFKIYEPKERIIYQLPYYPDRIVHHILMNVLEPIFVKWFINNSYSCIKGRGIHSMSWDIKQVLRKHPKETTWCLKLDIHKFYPNIDQDILVNVLKKKIKDKWVIGILDDIIHSTNKGVPIGNYLSQFFANIYLNELDHWVKEVLKVKFYYRYCDDIVILGKNKKQLYSIYRRIGQKLSFIKLRLKRPKIFPTENGIDFVGYVFRHNYVLLRKRIKVKFKKIANKYLITHFNKYKHKIASYYGWLIHCDGIHLLKTYIKELYYGFKKHYYKDRRSRICKLGKCRKITTRRKRIYLFFRSERTDKTR